MKKKIAIMSNVTIDMFVTGLKKEYDVFIPSGFNNMASYIFNPSSQLYTEKFDAIFLIFDGYESRNWMNDNVAWDVLDDWKGLVEGIVNKEVDTPIFVSTVAIQGNRIKTLSDKTFWREWENKWYDFIFEKSKKHRNIYVLDLAAIIYEYGKKQFYSSKMWYMGNMPYTKQGIDLIKEEIRYTMMAMYGERKKAIAIDLDNTLWGGVIGEDGPDGIVLSNHKEGQRFYDFQQALLEIKKKGVLLTILSKNNYEDVKPVWNNPYMLIKEDDLVDYRINWNPKYQNLIEMQEELKLTSGSFVFIDDNPAERELMSQEKECVVAPFPEDTTQLLDFAVEVYREYFLALKDTEEDMAKTEMYKQESERRKIEKAATSFDDYLLKLEIKVDIHQMLENEIDRVVQLINKTNQFNLTTIRYDEKDIIEMHKKDDTDIFVAYMSDKYGDSGLVSVIIIKKESDNVYIDSFLMSCRVMGRKLENVILSELVRYYSTEFSVLTSKYIKTIKNAPVENLYDDLGFELIFHDENEKKYCCNMSEMISSVEQYASVSFTGGK